MDEPVPGYRLWSVLALVPKWDPMGDRGVRIGHIKDQGPGVEAMKELIAFIAQQEIPVVLGQPALMADTRIGPVDG